MSTTAKRRRAAIHEAGHAAVAAAQGYRLHGVEIDGRGGGFCAVELPPRRSLQALEDELVYALAGRMAEALANDEDWRKLDFAKVATVETSNKGGIRDRGGSHELAAERFWGGRHYGQAWLRGAYARAAEESVRILSARWQEVTNLAYRLWHEGTVDFLEEEVRALEARSVGDASGLVRRMKRDARNRLRTRLSEAEVDMLVRFAFDDSNDVCDRSYVRAALAAQGHRERVYR